jgi:hypothetical protein
VFIGILRIAYADHFVCHVRCFSEFRALPNLPHGAMLRLEHGLFGDTEDIGARFLRDPALE